MEYIIETKTKKDWQKCLNQWKHNYIIIIHKAIFIDEMLTLIIERLEK